ncbi:thiopurine S-methyltransferase [Lysobacter arvi]|uniref:Thiopurine S-methyltransferase n=1 Tax=Lysobacter arvi TaxID=3038776 RepID=A0ABU1CBU7_9GAMM|nr:thiopurine S-methyltransferase [Lysobacter arvi]MDR0182637.1 thiopurine S-methyltransferase [Lysobacter arvi]
MHPDFWHQRWADNQIGFHQDAPTPLMLKHWPSLGLAAGTRVFVPLAGKTLDMAWLAAQGHRVLGVELSRIAVDAFFEGNGVTPEVTASKYGTHYRAGDIELICGDAFGLDEAALARCDAVFDRAALIALPEDLRQRYARELYARLPSHCRGLLITLEYPQHEKAGPPFSVVENEVRALYARDWTIETLERRDILETQPKFVEEGVTELHTSVYRLERKR